ncbi:MAG: sigma-70 family RNA polymerase sigma factor [Rubripirellula sp.]|nr:sigma-70 family RNA polymerase sigma factor [Rubripirellula sp.]
MSDDRPPRTNSETSVETAEERAASWRLVFENSLGGLRAFLRKRLPQDSDIDDCLQVVFVKLIEKGDSVAAPALKSWLFRVAANESARIWRSKAAAEKMYQKHGGTEVPTVDPTDAAIQAETTKHLKQALKQLPDAWQQVVHLRLYENLTFQQIADRLDVPLGTALTRMRRALERLRNNLK